MGRGRRRGRGELARDASSDSLVSARKIRQPIATNDDIVNAFDGITYQKGAAVLTMFERWIGAEMFQRGVRAYLRSARVRQRDLRDFVQRDRGRQRNRASRGVLDRSSISPACRSSPSRSPARQAGAA